MSSRRYRTTLYDTYESFQPSWQEEAAKSDIPWTRAALRRLRGWLPTDRTANCLDLGCGNGRLLTALATAGYTRLLGVDRSPQAIEGARRRGFSAIHADLVQYLTGSAEHYDLITAFDVVEHFGKDELLDLLHLVRSRLAPNGRFIIQTPNASSPWASSYRYGDLTHELMFDAKCLMSVSRVTGFGDVYAREVGPHIHGVSSAIRKVGWGIIWSSCALWNLIETGSTQGGIYTRNMMVLCINNRDSNC